MDVYREMEMNTETSAMIAAVVAAARKAALMEAADYFETRGCAAVARACVALIDREDGNS